MTTKKRHEAMVGQARAVVKDLDWFGVLVGQARMRAAGAGTGPQGENGWLGHAV